MRGSAPARAPRVGAPRVSGRLAAGPPLGACSSHGAAEPILARNKARGLGSVDAAQARGPAHRVAPLGSVDTT
eukprot:609390-Alexandrium_andersonii.AAC.1